MVSLQASDNVAARGLGGVERNIPYEGSVGRWNRLDVYLPDGPSPTAGWPVVVAIHGGGWRKLSKESYGPRAAALTSSGFAVVAPNYTLSTAGRPSWPVNLNDLQGVLRWIAENAKTYDLDTSRVASMGESAGGHLALMLGMASTLDDFEAPIRIKAIVNFSGPTDLVALARISRGAVPAVTRLLGNRAELVPDLAERASPINQVDSRTPPVLTVHGTRDSLVPVSQARELRERLNAANVPNQLLLVPAGHVLGFSNDQGQVLAATVAFLKRFLN